MAHKTIYRSKAGSEAIRAKYNDLLRHWPLSKLTHRISTRHGDTHVIACGDSQNPPLILLHGAAHCSIRWLNDVETFCKSHRVYVVDIIGEPNHSDSRRPNPKTRAYSEWLEDIFSELKLSEAALVGENLGAWIAMQFACSAPERVSHLGLLSPAGIVSTRKSFKLRAFFSLLLGPLGQGLLMGRIAKGADIDPKAKGYHKLVRKHFKPRRRSLPRIPGRALSQLYCPVLLMVGKKDTVFSADKQLLRLARWVPQLEVIYRNDDGHWLSTCTREVDRFLVTQYPAD